MAFIIRDTTECIYVSNIPAYLLDIIQQTDTLPDIPIKCYNLVNGFLVYTDTHSILNTTQYNVIFTKFPAYELATIGSMPVLENVQSWINMAVYHNMVEYVIPYILETFKITLVQEIYSQWTANDMFDVVNNTTNIVENIEHTDASPSANEKIHTEYVTMIANSPSNQFKQLKILNYVGNVPTHIILELIQRHDVTDNKNYLLALFMYLMLKGDTCHLLFTDEIQALFVDQNSYTLHSMFEYACVAVNLLYLKELNTHMNSMKEDPHILKDMDKCIMMDIWRLNQQYKNPFDILIYRCDRKVYQYEGSKLYTVPKIDIGVYKKRLNLVTSGLSSHPNFPWNEFMLVGSSIFVSLIKSGNDLWTSVGDLDIIYYKEKLTIDELHTKVTNNILPLITEKFDNIKVTIIQAKKTQRVRIHQDPPEDLLKEIDVYCNRVGDISRYHSGPTNGFWDGEKIHGYMRFWSSLYNRSMPTLMCIKADNPAVLLNKYMAKCNIACDAGYVNLLHTSSTSTSTFRCTGHIPSRLIIPYTKTIIEQLMSNI